MRKCWVGGSYEDRRASLTLPEMGCKGGEISAEELGTHILLRSSSQDMQKQEKEARVLQVSIPTPFQMSYLGAVSKTL